MADSDNAEIQINVKGVHIPESFGINGSLHADRPERTEAPNHHYRRQDRSRVKECDRCTERRRGPEAKTNLLGYAIMKHHFPYSS
jgi:hypothetical protein